jgi:hypothetical protein
MGLKGCASLQEFLESRHWVNVKFYLPDNKASIRRGQALYAISISNQHTSCCAPAPDYSAGV